MLNIKKNMKPFCEENESFLIEYETFLQGKRIVFNMFITLLVIYMQLLLIGSCTPVYDFTSYTHATFIEVQGILR